MKTARLMVWISLFLFFIDSISDDPYQTDGTDQIFTSRNRYIILIKIHVKMNALRILQDLHLHQFLLTILSSSLILYSFRLETSAETIARGRPAHRMQAFR